MLPNGIRAQRDDAFEHAADVQTPRHPAHALGSAPARFNILRRVMNYQRILCDYLHKTNADPKHKESNLVNIKNIHQKTKMPGVYLH